MTDNPTVMAMLSIAMVSCALGITIGIAIVVFVD